MINREFALKILKANLKNQNLFRHCLAAEAAMKALARRFREDEEKWGLVGLLHDGDWEKTKDNPAMHTKQMVEWLKKAGEERKELLQAILSHNYVHTGDNPPETPLEWAIYTCDELTGLIVACALVMPDKKLSSVTVETVLKKFHVKSFAAAVNREQIKHCEEKLEIPLSQFIEIILEAMQGIAEDLGL